MVRYLITEKECFEKGLLKKTEPNKDLARKSIRQVEFFLSEAKDLVELNKMQIAALSLYNAFFHAVRFLLFKDGIKERSHYCTARYFEENYIKTKKINEKFLNAFETLMSLRHNVQYSTEKVEIEEDLNELIGIGEQFIVKLIHTLQE